jgi:DNA polymerase III epsilon subunit-like protein
MKNYTVIDLEWTSWKNNYFGKYKELEKRELWQKKEIIQIGAVKFNKNFKIKKLLNIIVKPKINKKLSKHIISLTSLTDEIINKKGYNFLDAYKKLIKFSNNSFLFCNGYDGEVLRENLSYNRSKLKLIKVLNIKKILENNYKIPKKYLSSPLIKTFFGYKFLPNKAHNAVEDCKSIFLALRKMKFNLNIIEKKNFFLNGQ